MKPICTSISRAICSLLLCWCCLTANGQTQQKDTTALFQGLSVSADLVGFLQRQLGSYGQYEAALHVNLRDKYFPVVELGLGEADADDIATQLKYKTHAPYGRLGCDFNILKNKHDHYRAYAGFRYGFTSFKYDLESPGLNDPVWNEHVPFGAEGVKCYQHWIEGVFTIDAYIWGPLRMGWSARYKRRVAHDHNGIGKPWYIPGYGTDGNTRLGGSFNITLEI